MDQKSKSLYQQVPERYKHRIKSMIHWFNTRITYGDVDMNEIDNLFVYLITNNIVDSSIKELRNLIDGIEYYPYYHASMAMISTLKDLHIDLNHQFTTFYDTTSLLPIVSFNYKTTLDPESRDLYVKIACQLLKSGVDMSFSHKRDKKAGYSPIVVISADENYRFLRDVASSCMSTNDIKTVINTIHLFVRDASLLSDPSTKIIVDSRGITPTQLVHRLRRSLRVLTQIMDARTMFRTSSRPPLLITTSYKPRRERPSALVEDDKFLSIYRVIPTKYVNDIRSISKWWFRKNVSLQSDVDNDDLDQLLAWMIKTRKITQFTLEDVLVLFDSRRLPFQKTIQEIVSIMDRTRKSIRQDMDRQRSQQQQQQLRQQITITDNLLRIMDYRSADKFYSSTVMGKIIYCYTEAVTRPIRDAYIKIACVLIHSQPTPTMLYGSRPSSGDYETVEHYIVTNPLFHIAIDKKYAFLKSIGSQCLSKKSLMECIDTYRYMKQHIEHVRNYIGYVLTINTIMARIDECIYIIEQLLIPSVARTLSHKASSHPLARSKTRQSVYNIIPELPRYSQQSSLQQQQSSSQQQQQS